MISSRPKGSEFLAWLSTGLWLAIIYIGIFYARSLQAFVVENFGRQSFLWFVVASILLVSVFLAHHFYQQRQHYGLSNYIVFAAVVASYLGFSFKLGSGSPEEGLHFLEYGVLYFLFYRALVFRVPHVSVFLLAFLATSLAGNIDEIIQWLAPARFFDWRDVGLNAFSALMAALLLAFGLRPRYLSKSYKQIPVELLSILIFSHLSISAFCLANSASLTSGLRNSLPLSSELTAMTEYGHLYQDPEIGSFKSRMSPQEMRTTDEKSGARAALVLGKYKRNNYGVLLEEFSPEKSPYLHELLVRLFRRDSWLERKNSQIAFKESLILKKYFPKFSKNYFKEGELMPAADKLSSEDKYFSEVSRGLITLFDRAFVKKIYISFVVLILLCLFAFKSSTR